MAKRAWAELALVAITLIWGTTFVVVKSALGEISTFLFLALRFTLAALVLGAVYGRKMKTSGFWPGVLAGTILFLAYALQTRGLETTTAAKSAFLTGLTVPMVPLAGSLVYRIRPRLFEVAGIVTATAGMALMTLPAGGFGIGTGDLLSFLCAVAFALHIVVLGHFSPVIGFETMAVVQIATAALLALGSFGFAGPVRFHAAPAAIAAVVVTGLFATALAFSVLAWAQQYTSPVRAALIFSLEPVVAWLTSWVAAGETLSLRAGIGAVLILGGVLVVELKRAKVEQHPTNRVVDLKV